MLSLFFAICSASLIPHKKDKRSANPPDFFTFATKPDKQYTLYNDNIPDQEYNVFSSLFKRLSKSNNNQKQWYYVHIYGDISKVQKYINLRPEDQIVKNTFILYLSESQIEQISPYSIFSLIDPTDKIDIISPFNETNYFHVQTAPNSDLSSIDNLFTIEKVNKDNSYIIRVDQANHESPKAFLQKKKKVAQILSQQPSVKVVSTYKKPVLQNNINIAFVQKNRQEPHRDGYSNLNILDRCVHNHGLTGEGQIITIEDSPIDFRHPMFKDEKNDVVFNTDMPNHRKFLFYQSYTDMKGWEANLKAEEHGTHTAGTLAGKSIVDDKSKSMSHLFDGAAPDAKLVYAGLYGNITGEDLERAMNTHNSRISSNSWGDSDKYVDSLNYEYGVLAYKNPQSIFIFAAGNYGISGNFSIIDPSGSKNVLSVSATSNPLLANLHQFGIQSEKDRSIIIMANGIFPTKYFLYSSEFLGTKKGEAEIIAVKYEKDSDGNTDAVCKMLNGTHISVLYGEDYSEMANFLDFCFTEYTNGILITTDVEGIKKLLSIGGRIKATLNSDVKATLPIMKGSYASIGPGNKGMVKPDVTAPGTAIVSSMSYLVDGQPYTCKDVNTGCGLVIKEGTSMSTPNVAGNAALVAQYFKTGKWIDSTELDGSTLRALLINSCNHPNKEKVPDTFFGHGVVDISNILPLEGDFGVQIPRQDKATTVKEEGHVVAKIDVKSAKVDLQVTLSYLDVMLEQSSPIPLTRDLDLVVVSPDGKIFRGDHLPNGDTQHLSTNEKVIVTKEELMVGTYTVHIFGNKFFDSSLSSKDSKKLQNFSVVATGDIDNKYIEFAESSESPCASADSKRPGYCKCNEDQIGPTCETKITNFDRIEKVDLELEPHLIYRLRFTSDLIITQITSYYEYYVRYPTIWISPTCHESLHEYEMNGYIGWYLPESINISFGTKEICVALFANTDIKAKYHFSLAGVEAPPDDGKEGGSNDDKKLDIILLVVIIIACLAFVALLAVIIIIIVRKMKGKRMESELAADV